MKAGDRVLDVCCGTGAQVLEYGRRGIIATGIDISSGMLIVAERNKMKQKMTNVNFEMADAVNLPFPNNYFDYASLTLGLHDKQRTTRYQIISEMKRVVKKDGTIILVDFQVPLPKNVWAFLARTIEFIAGGSHYKAFKEYVKNNGLSHILQRSGLKEQCASSLKTGLFVAIKVIKDE
jgi:ubiquinone/menaquinone biosynthesis C-methylase UbiE